MPKVGWPAKSRTFTFTTFKLDLDYEAMIGDKVRYIAFGSETCPKTGRPPHQGWICFPNQRSTKPSGLKRIGASLGGAHVEPKLGSLDSKDEYCSKES